MAQARERTADERPARGSETNCPPTAEQLRDHLDSLRSCMPALSQATQAEFLPLIDELERRLGRDPPQPAEAARLLAEIEAIDKCVRFELAISLAEATARSPESGSADRPQRRLDAANDSKPHRHSLRPVLPEAGGATDNV